MSVRPEPVEPRAPNTAPLRFAGYAALFDVADAAGDVIRKGAFSRTLAERAELPLLWQHDPARRIGRIETLTEDERGLRVIARIESAGRAGAELLRRAVSGLSFGYRARQYRRLPKGRLLEDIELFEVSLVTHPLQHGARVHLIGQRSSPARGGGSPQG